MSFAERIVKLPSGRKVRVLAGQRFTAEMREALDIQYAEWDKEKQSK